LLSTVKHVTDSGDSGDNSTVDDNVASIAVKQKWALMLKPNWRRLLVNLEGLTMCLVPYLSLDHLVFRICHQIQLVSLTCVRDPCLVMFLFLRRASSFQFSEGHEGSRVQLVTLADTRTAGSNTLLLADVARLSVLQGFEASPLRLLLPRLPMLACPTRILQLGNNMS
jgi:hypothetical protein